MSKEIQLHDLNFNLNEYNYIFNGNRMILSSKEHKLLTRGKENNKPYILPEKYWHRLFMMETVTIPHGKNWKIIPQIEE